MRVGFVGLLQLALIVLKLCGVLHWAWPLVLLPAILGCGLGVLVVILFLLVAAIRTASARRRYR